MSFVRSLAILGVMAIAVLPGCRDTTLPEPAEAERTGIEPVGSVVVTASEGQIWITNQTDQPIFTLIFGDVARAGMNWTACVTPVGCGRIVPGGTREASYPNRSIPEGETQAVVYWWHAVAEPTGELVPGPYRVVKVEL